MAYYQSLQVGDSTMGSNLSGGLVQGGYLDLQNHVNNGNFYLQVNGTGMNLVANATGLSGAVNGVKNLTIQNLGLGCTTTIKDAYNNAITIGQAGIQFSISGNLGASGTVLTNISGGYLAWH